MSRSRLSDGKSLQQADRGPAEQYLESPLPGGVRARIIQIDGDEGTFDNTKVYEVPPDTISVIGNNRDN